MKNEQNICRPFERLIDEILSEQTNENPSNDWFLFDQEHKRDVKGDGKEIAEIVKRKI